MGVQCYELFGGIALKNHSFSFSFFHLPLQYYGFQSVYVMSNIRMSGRSLILMIATFMLLSVGEGLELPCWLQLHRY